MTNPSLSIIGHGLAGAILAETASRRGFSVRVCDDGGPASSRVAAGLYTPLTGQRLIPSWRLEDALPVVNSFYPDLEKRLGASFFHPLPTCRIFQSAKQRNEWQTRGDSAFTREMKVAHLPFDAPFAGLRIDGGGWVDLPVMLDALKARRIQQDEWDKHPKADIILHATGAKAAEHPLWQDVGWRNAHGDVLTVRIPDLPSDHIYSFGKFLLPLGGDLFRCGATYTWNEKSPAPRTSGRKELEEHLSDILQIPFEVVDHQAGIRPVALARVPVAGPHPEQPNQWIFNGFGSKGVLYAPWMAERLLDFITHNNPLPKETIAKRRIQRQRDRAATAQNQKK
jgi:glycine/D-amino acid oxidase-like deaminating enzyme